MKFAKTTFAFGLVALLSMGFSAQAEKTKAQCEPSCTNELHSCAVQVVSYCAGKETNYDGCYRGAKEKCKLGGVRSNGVYEKCINKCMSSE